MKRRQYRINTIATGTVLAMLLGYGIYTFRTPIIHMAAKYLSESVIRQSELLYLPGMLYQETGQHSFEDWVAGEAVKITSLGAFAEKYTVSETDVEDTATYEMILRQQANDENAVDENGKLVNGEDNSQQTIHSGVVPIDTSVEKMRDFTYLLSNFYTVDSTTMIREDELRGEELLAKNMKMNMETGGPKILIYHTHSQEMFADSVPGDPSTSIVGVGDYLTTLLNDTYHIPTIHHTGVYDLIDGKLDRSKAYDMAKPDIQRILEENPSIEVVIDLHRDGVGETTHLVTEVNGKQTAQIMFFNGLSKTRANGEIDYLANPYIQENLAFSLQMQVAAYEKYPGFARRIYLRGYRYNMHFMPKSLLVEAGAQTNTVEEMKNAMEILAELLNGVLIG